MQNPKKSWNFALMQHKSYTIKEIEEIIGAQGFISDPKADIRDLAFDSRKLSDFENTLFFALKGRRDGHDYLKEVYEAGVRNFVVSETPSTLHFPNANFLLVNNTLQSLQLIAARHRKQFEYPVIGITGSNGKTIVKEWLYQLLAPDQNIVRSPKSYNSQIGVPLSVWQMTEENTLGIFEAGISHAGEMAALQEIIMPDIGILTNIGDAHNEGFRSEDEKISEKLLLFKDCELFIYSPKYLHHYTGTIPGKRHFTWGWEGNTDLRIIHQQIVDEKWMSLKGLYQQKEVSCVVPFIDAASVENAICCWASLLAMNGDHSETIEWRLKKLHPVKMRLELKDGINNCSVIDDSYSLDISSLSIALDFLNQQNQHSRKTLILSDIPESGTDPERLYAQVAKLVKSKKIQHLVGVGVEISKNADKFKLEKHFYKSTKDLIEQLDSLKLANETILLKGARAFEFEQISSILTRMVHETVLEINLNALEHNLNYYKSKLGKGVKLMVMVKAFSYGSGSFEIANLLQFNKVDYLAVAYADEGVTLRKAGITLPIMVMNPDASAYNTMIEHQLEPEIYSFRILADFTEALSVRGISDYPVHIKLDTGMHRLGFVSRDMTRLKQELLQNKNIRIASAFSHLVASEDPASDTFTRSQISKFRIMTDEIERLTGYSFIKHISNTSGITRHPEAQFDMVRLGIGMYGFDSAFKHTRSPLETVTTLKTSISQIKELEPGESVGYNRKGILLKGGKIATVKIGYADGYSRRLGNGKGQMLVKGHLVSTIGNICMDMCMLDITGIDAVEGEEVVVFNDTSQVLAMAELLETIPYEILTSISERVKRVYFFE